MEEIALSERETQIYRKGEKPFEISCNKNSLTRAINQRACVFCGSRVVLYIPWPMPWACSAMTRAMKCTAASLPPVAEQERPYVAVATLEGVLVNQHLGEASHFQIWEKKEDGSFNMVEERPASLPGGGPQRWHNLARALRDCRAVLVNDLGESPKEILRKMGVKTVTMSGFIEIGLEAVYSGKDLSKLKGRQNKCTSKGACSGGGTGCG